MSIYQHIFNRLEALVGGIAEFASTPGNHKILQAKGFMDLHIECIGKNHISLAHYYVQEGDLMADPEMEVKIIPENMMAEALTFMQASPPIFQRVYTEDGKRYYPRLRSDLNSFLRTWLKNLEDQGFYNLPKNTGGRLPSVCEQLFRRLDVLTEGIVKFTSTSKDEMMRSTDLGIGCVQEDVISLAHYVEQEGRRFADRRLNAVINPKTKRAEVLTVYLQDRLVYELQRDDSGRAGKDIRKKMADTGLLGWLIDLEKAWVYAFPKINAEVG